MRTAVEDGSVALDQLLEKLAEVPTLAGPTLHQLDGKLFTVYSDSTRVLITMSMDDVDRLRLPGRAVNRGMVTG